MNKIQSSSALVAAVALMLALGCAAPAQQETAGEYVDDTVITSRVKTAILNEPSLKVLQINVETYKNVVQLSGFVGTYAEMNKAAGLARAVPGVAAVKNDIRLK